MTSNRGDMRANQCPVCGTGELQIIQQLVTETPQGPVPPFRDELTKCKDCGEEFYTPAQSLASSRAFAAATRKIESLLSPEDIYAARIALGMTQSQFEVALGVGKKTVIRWEKGTVPPSRAANGLLWVALRYPDVFLEYAREQAPELHPRDPSIVGRIDQGTSPDAPAIAIRFSEDGENQVSRRDFPITTSTATAESQS